MINIFAFFIYFFCTNTCSGFDAKKNERILIKEFYKDSFWLMPSDPYTGECYFQTKREAKLSLKIVPIPILAKYQNNILIFNSNDIFGFILKRGIIIGAMRLTKSKFGYAKSLDDDVDVNVYKFYINNKCNLYLDGNNGDFVVEKNKLILHWNSKKSTFE